MNIVYPAQFWMLGRPQSETNPHTLSPATINPGVCLRRAEPRRISLVMPVRRSWEEAPAPVPRDGLLPLLQLGGSCRISSWRRGAEAVQSARWRWRYLMLWQSVRCLGFACATSCGGKPPSSAPGELLSGGFQLLVSVVPADQQAVGQSPPPTSLRDGVSLWCRCRARCIVDAVEVEEDVRDLIAFPF
jgi:hypothetical protein